MNQPPVLPPREPPAGPPDPADEQDWLAAWPERDEPTEAELYGLGPDPFAGPPDDGDAWLAELSAAELEAMFGNGADEGKDAGPGDGAAGAGFATGGWLDVLVPGPVLSSFSQDVVDSGFGSLSDDELVGVLRAARRISSWQAAVEFKAIGELDARRLRESGRPGWSRISEHVSSELAAALTLTGRSADSLLCLSRDLARLPVVLAALADGRIDRARAEIFAAELAALNDAAAAAVAAALCDIAGTMTTGQLRAALRSMVLAIDPAAVRRRAAKARADARVETWPESSGNGALAGRELATADTIAADRRIAAIARSLKEAGAAGTMDELRAVVFVALLTGRDPELMAGFAAPDTGDGGGSDGPDDSDRQGTGPGRTGPALGGSVNLTMPLSAWLGESDSPGEVAGFGPLDADTCRDLAGRLRSGPGARWCVTLTDRFGRAVAHACARAGPGPPGPPRPPGPAGWEPPVSQRAWLGRLRFARIECGICGHEHQVPGYRPGNVLRNLVKVRQRTCGFPGCRRPAVACDDDHTVPYEQGGITCECNLAPLCRQHHRCKQAPGWHVTQPSPGVLVWTTPHGRSYTARPDAYPV